MVTKWMIYSILSVALITILAMMFFISSKKEKWETNNSTLFECGFNSYFFSRHSFSMHYFLIGLIFLFLDLELCFMLPLFLLHWSNLIIIYMISFFIIILLSGILMEWLQKALDWKF